MIDVMGSGFMMRSADYDDLGGIPAAYPNLLFADFELLINLTKKAIRPQLQSNVSHSGCIRAQPLHRPT